MSQEKIAIPKEVIEKLRQQIEVEVTYKCRARNGHYYSFSSEKDALEYLKQNWIEEQQLRSKFIFCPHCGNRLDIPLKVVQEHAEAMARLQSIKCYIEEDVNHLLRYDLTKKWYENGIVNLEDVREIVTEIRIELQERVYGLDRAKRFDFPENHILLEALNETKCEFLESKIYKTQKGKMQKFYCTARGLHDVLDKREVNYRCKQRPEDCSIRKTALERLSKTTQPK